MASPPADLVQRKVFAAKHKKTKVKVEIDGAGLRVVEDNKRAKQILAYPVKKIGSWKVSKKKTSLELQIRKEKKPVVLDTKQAEAVAQALQALVMAVVAWKEMQKDSEL